MRQLTLCMVTKFPPIQGGVSQQSYWLAHELARQGHAIHVVTNASEVEPDFRAFIPRAERHRLEGRYDSGGFVRVHTTREDQRAHRYIPYANPFVSKLAALAYDVVTEQRCDFIATSYLEPYALAGCLVSSLTGVPFSVRHAGSDLMRLARDPARRSIYLAALRRADLVITTGFLAAAFVSAGVQYDRLVFSGASASQTGDFAPGGAALDVEQLLTEATADGVGPAQRPARPFEPSLPTLGVYGKVAAHKGIFELVRAAAELARDGRAFNLLLMCGTQGPGPDALAMALAEAELGDHAYQLPLLPPWLVPRFIRTCTAVCTLENRFAIAMHTPELADEVLRCGRALVMSEELRGKSPRAKALVHCHSALIVRDPADTAELRSALAWVLDHPRRTEEVASRGARIGSSIRPGAGAAQLLARMRSTMEERKAMSLETLQSTLGQLYTSRDFRHAFASAPERALSQLNLDDAEREVLRRVAHKLVPSIARFSRALVAKKLEWAMGMFERSAMYLKAARADIVAALECSYDHLPRTAEDDLRYFGEFLRTWVTGSPSSRRHELPNFLSELLLFELFLRLADLPVPTSSPQTSAAARALDDDDTQPAFLPFSEPDVVTLCSTARVHEFGFPVQEIWAAPDGRTSLPAKRTSIAFTGPRGVTPAQAHVLAPVLSRLAANAREPRRVSLLIADAAEWLGQSAPRADVKALALKGLNHLGEKSILVRAA